MNSISNAEIAQDCDGSSPPGFNAEDEGCASSMQQPSTVSAGSSPVLQSVGQVGIVTCPTSSSMLPTPDEDDPENPVCDELAGQADVTAGVDNDSTPSPRGAKRCICIIYLIVVVGLICCSQMFSHDRHHSHKVISAFSS